MSRRWWIFSWGIVALGFFAMGCGAWLIFTDEPVYVAIGVVVVFINTYNIGRMGFLMADEWGTSRAFRSKGPNS